MLSETHKVPAEFQVMNHKLEKDVKVVVAKFNIPKNVGQDCQMSWPRFEPGTYRTHVHGQPQFYVILFSLQFSIPCERFGARFPTKATIFRQ